MAARSVGECCLRWTDHDSLLQGVCNNLLLNEKFADVTLFCGGVSMKCHKFILSACSTYFDQIFSEAPCDHPIIVLKDVSPWQMQALLHFIYRGELTTDETKLTSLLQLAQSLNIKGIGEFGGGMEDANNSAPRKRRKTSDILQQEKSMKNERDFLNMESSMSTLTERLMNLPPESQQLLGTTELSSTMDTTDFTLQETEVEYSFEPESLDDSQHMHHQPILVEYSEEANTYSPSKKKNAAESETDGNSDASMSAAIAAANPVYKKYTEEDLLTAIRAVFNDGVKQVDACIKYGIPFTTLSRKMRLYKACGGCLPPKRKDQPRSPNVSLATVLSVENELGATSALASQEDKVVLVIQDSESLEVPNTEPKMTYAFKQYKTYTEANLKAAIAAVLRDGMRLQDASNHFKIPLSTLTRKIRSPKTASTTLTSAPVDTHSS